MQTVVRLLAGAVGVLLAATMLAPAAAQARPRQDPYPPSGCATLSVGDSSAVSGGQFAMSGNNFEPGSTVHLVIDSGAADLGRVSVGDDGTFSRSFTVPQLDPGSHVVSAVGGVQETCSTAGPQAQMAVLAANGDRGPTAAGAENDNGTSLAIGGLSSTGVNIIAGVLLAVALIVAGVLLLGGDRRLRRRRSLLRR